MRCMVVVGAVLLDSFWFAACWNFLKRLEFTIVFISGSGSSLT